MDRDEAVKVIAEVNLLKNHLKSAGEMIKLQAAELAELKAPPRVFATVIRLGQMRLDDPKLLRYLENAEVGKVGARVRIRKDSEFAHQNSDVGVVEEFEVDSDGDPTGWVTVRFPGGYRNNYRTGMFGKTPDLESADKKKGTDDKGMVPSATIVSSGGGVAEVPVPAKLVSKLKRGDVVHVAPTGGIIDLADTKFGGGIAVVRRVVDQEFAEVDTDSGTHMVYRCGAEMKEDDRVVLDHTGFVITKNLGKQESKFRFEGSTGITWKDIGGLEEAKATMREVIELPHTNRKLFEHYGKRPAKGVLLYGPPGCGKTMLGKAAASAIAAIHGKTASSGFLYIKGPEILSKFVGESEATIRSIFARAREHHKENGYPAVVFIDEADAILARRGIGISSDIERTIVPMFLAEMDGLGDSGALVLLATNRSDILDPAVVRDGRVDRKVKITRPDEFGAAQIFQLALEKVPVVGKKDDVALAAAKSVFKDERAYYDIAVKGMEIKRFTLADLLNGGMIWSIVDQASTLALRRDMKAGGKKLGGVTGDDLENAINLVEDQNRDLGHDEAFADFVAEFKADIVNVRPVHRKAVR